MPSPELCLHLYQNSAGHNCQVLRTFLSIPSLLLRDLYEWVYDSVKRFFCISWVLSLLIRWFIVTNF